MGGVVVNDRVNGSLSVTRAFGDLFLKQEDPTALLHSRGMTNRLLSVTPSVSAVDIITADEALAMSGGSSTGGISEDAFIVIACDGLFDVMDDQELVMLVMEGWVKLSQAMPGYAADRKQGAGLLTEILARAMVEEALRRGSTDNCTCQIVLL